MYGPLECRRIVRDPVPDRAVPLWCVSGTHLRSRGIPMSVTDVFDSHQGTHILQVRHLITLQTVFTQRWIVSSHLSVTAWECVLALSLYGCVFTPI